MQALTDKRIITRMVLLFSITYMVSYITRINYGAIISEMITDTGMSKSMLSLAITGSFITYGAGHHLLLDHCDHGIAAAKGEGTDHEKCVKQLQIDHFSTSFFSPLLGVGAYDTTT